MFIEHMENRPMRESEIIPHFYALIHYQKHYISFKIIFQGYLSYKKFTIKENLTQRKNRRYAAVGF